MNSSEPRGPFSSSDEAFFHAGVQAELEPLSERPVTLEGDEIVADTEARLSARDARRERLKRAVTSTLAALSLLALLGLGRYALRPGLADSGSSKADVVRVPMPGSAALDSAQDATPVGEILASIGDAYDDDATELTPSSCEAPVTARLIGPEPAPAGSAPDTGGAAEPQNEGARESAGPPSAKHPGAKPTRAPARHGATPVHRRVKGAPVSKSALLRAIRAS